jgi:hypothetical protein
MTHPDPEILLSSVGGSLDHETEQHVATCPQCRADLAAMTRVRAAGSMLASDPSLGTLTAPPPAVWEGIQRELDEPGVPSPVATLPSPERRPRSRRTWLVVAASVAAGAVLGASAVALVGRDDDSTSQAARTSTLEPLEGHVTTGTLSMSGPPSSEALSVELRDADAGDGFLEVWLLDAKTGGMVSLGVLDGDRGSYAVPPGLDLAAYDQVDVSREPYDGDPAHSKVSLARGQVP